LNAPISEADVTRFWELFVPLVQGDVRQHLNNLPPVVKAVENKFSRQERRTLYRLLNRFALILVCRLEPHYLHHGGKPKIPVRSYFHLWMLAQHIICTGRQAYLDAVAEPLSVLDHLPQLTDHTGLFALSVFRYEEVIFESQKLRLIQAFQFPHDPAKKQANLEMLRTQDFSALSPVERTFITVAQRVSGFFNLTGTLQGCFQGPEFHQGYPELYPTFEELPSGEVRIASYGTVTVDTPLASELKSLPS
jgi:hypothetical protein